MIDLGKFKVRINRYTNKAGNVVTHATIFNDKEAGIVGMGQVSCSHNDCFTKKTGTKLAIKQAFANGNSNKKDRKVFWSNYRNKMTKKPRW